MRIWKCDTKWNYHGCTNGNDSILDVVTDFKLAFFNTGDVDCIGDYKNVTPGDLIGISQGTRIVAVAEATSRCAPINELAGNTLPRVVVGKYVDSSVMAIRLSNVTWLKTSVINGRRGGRFFELKPTHNDYKAVKAGWERGQLNCEDVEFDIDAGKRILVSRNEEGRGLLAGSHIRYVVPVYQRPYAWGENEILRLMEDIIEGMKSGEKRFIGSVQVSAPRHLNGDTICYDLIDGQQRLSTLIILLKLLGIDYSANLRTVVNAGSAQRDWDDFADVFGTDKVKEYSLNKYVHAAGVIAERLRSLQDDFQDLTQEVIKRRLAEYVMTKLIFVVIQTKAGISKTIQIFNVINTAGMDLNASDLFKIRFYEYLTRGTGPNDEVFNGISKCYQKVEDYNRQLGSVYVSMSDVMSLYQKAIVSKFSLNSDLFSMGTQRFFEQLFDTLIEGKRWQGFVDKGISLSYEGFCRAVDVLLRVDTLTREDPAVQIMRNFIWETRYGGVAYQYPVMACYFNFIKIDSHDVFDFSTRLFKRLIAPSMRFGKVVNDVRSTKMRKLLIALSHSNDEVNSILNTPWIVKGESEQTMLRTGLNQDLVYSPPWKRLACKLVEFLLSDKKCTKELGRRLFSLGYDVEHIQSYTDEADRERIWKEWDWELNGLGNLAMLEYSLNRSIQNDTSKKLSAYRQSKFKSIEKIVPEMEGGKWTLVQARKRREDLSKMICDYVWGENRVGGENV